MTSVTIRLRDNGPLVVQGPVRIIDAEGGEFTITSDKPALALCRCGCSKNRPFCDGSHRECGFVASDRAR
jgi:CDGSH-type Zn-finger protein